MPIPGPVSDSVRAINHERDQTWPSTVSIELRWQIDGATFVRSAVITADQFFGLGSFGAPLPGDAVIGMIENMRRAGPPSLGTMKAKEPRLSPTAAFRKNKALKASTPRTNGKRKK